MYDDMLVTDHHSDVNGNAEAFTESFERIIMPIYKRDFGTELGIESVIETYPFTPEEIIKCDIETEGLDKYKKFELLGKILQLGIQLIESTDIGIEGLKIKSYLNQTESENGYRDNSVLRLAFLAEYNGQPFRRIYLVNSAAGTVEIKTELLNKDTQKNFAETNYFK